MGQPHTHGARLSLLSALLEEIDRLKSDLEVEDNQGRYWDRIREWHALTVLRLREQFGETTAVLFRQFEIPHQLLLVNKQDYIKAASSILDRCKEFLTVQVAGALGEQEFEVEHSAPLSRSLGTQNVPTAASPSDPYRLVGDIFAGKYRLMEYAGGGGMGAVYRAMDNSRQMVVAVKVLKPDVAARNPEYIALFQKEVNAAKRLAHPNIVKVLDNGFDQSIAFMVMEWLDGELLEDLITRESRELDRIVHIFEQICGAMSFAHANGVIHLDIKPSNIMLVKEAESRDFIKIIDFGLARIISRESGTTVTKFRGTHQYCAPEQFGGKVSNRSDIYSLGATLYYLLTGVLPFGASYINAKVHPNLELPPIPSIARQRNLPTAVDVVLRKALQKNPALRQTSATQLFEEFYRAVSGQSAASIISQRERNYAPTAKAALHTQRQPIHKGVIDDLSLEQQGLDPLPKVAKKPSEHHYASYSRRAPAAVVDLLVVAVLSTPFVAIIEFTIGSWTDTRVLQFMILATFLVMFLYETFAIALAGTTIGMYLLGLHAEDEGTGRFPMAIQCALRALVFIVSLMLLGSGIILGLLRGDGRTLYDLVSEMEIVKKS